MLLCKLSFIPLISIIRRCEYGILQNQFVTQSRRCVLLICIERKTGWILHTSHNISLNIDNLYNSFQFIQKRIKLFIEFGTWKIAMHLPLVDYVYQFFSSYILLLLRKERWIPAIHRCEIRIVYLICARAKTKHITENEFDCLWTKHTCSRMLLLFFLA